MRKIRHFKKRHTITSMEADFGSSYLILRIQKLSSMQIDILSVFECLNQYSVSLADISLVKLLYESEIIKPVYDRLAAMRVETGCTHTSQETGGLYLNSTG